MSVLYYHKNSVAQALRDLFPNIGLTKSKLVDIDFSKFFFPPKTKITYLMKENKGRKKEGEELYGWGRGRVNHSENTTYLIHSVFTEKVCEKKIEKRRMKRGSTRYERNRC